MPGASGYDDAMLASGAAEPSDVLVMLRDGWQRGASYRVRLESLEDASGRLYEDGEEALEWSVPLPTPELPEPAVIFEQRFSTDYETYLASGNTVGGRFPGGQTCLFHGQWTDPVTGIAYARSRWYDPRNASWLSEDPVAERRGIRGERRSRHTHEEQSVPQRNTRGVQSDPGRVSTPPRS